MGCSNQSNYASQYGGSSQGGCNQCGGSAPAPTPKCGCGQCGGSAPAPAPKCGCSQSSQGGSNCGCQPVNSCQWYKCKYTVCQDHYYYKQVCSN